MKYSTETFIERAKQIHGDKYVYDKVDYVDSHTKIIITCPIHGNFTQTPNSHLNGNGCPKCGGVYRKNTEDFIKESLEIHGNVYDYSKVEYVNGKTKVCIICPIHGEFWQTPKAHLLGQGCKICSNIKNGLKKKKTTEEFVAKAKQIHGNKYDYSKVEYDGNDKDVCIVCPIHGEFWQTPHDHLSGKGCSKCKQSHLERNIEKLLKQNDLHYEYNKRYNWLENLQLDFYIPSKNIAIECQGTQHFLKNHFFESLEVVQERDKRKQTLCEENGIKLIYIVDNNIDIDKLPNNLYSKENTYNIKNFNFF